MRFDAHNRFTIALVLTLLLVGGLMAVMAAVDENEVGSTTVGTATAEAAINCDDAWLTGNVIAKKFPDIQYFARRNGICLSAKNGSKLFISYQYSETLPTRRHFYPLCSHVKRTQPLLRAVRDWIKQYAWNSLGRGCRSPGVTH